MFANIKRFDIYKTHLAPPHLIQHQVESYERFIKEGIKNVFQEFSPIWDYSGEDAKLELLDYYLGEPKLSEEEARTRGLNYEAPLRVKLRLTNVKENDVREQELYVGDLPVMTPRGTFLINGVERVIISQLVRSPGIYFHYIPFGERKLFGAKLIPQRGAWLEFQVEASNVLQVRIDRRKKVPVSVLLRAFGLEDNAAILDAFASEDVGEFPIIPATLKKDPTRDKEEALLEIHHKLRPIEPSTTDNIQSFFFNLFQNQDRYDLSSVGRHKVNERLGRNSQNRAIELEDLRAVVTEIVRLTHDPVGQPDDIDSLGNRRIRDFHELAENRFRLGMTRLMRTIRDRMSVAVKEGASPAQIVYPRPLMNAMREFFAAFPLSQFMDQVNPLAEVEHKRRISAAGPGGLNKERAGFEVRDVHPTHYGRLCPVQTPEGQNIGIINYLPLYARRNSLGFLETPYAKVEKGQVTKLVEYLNATQEQKATIAQGTTVLNERGRIVEDEVAARVQGQPGLVQRADVHYIDIAPQQPFSVGTALIPFLQHNDANRAQMGANMQRQALPLVKPEAPLVATGLEHRVAVDSGYVITAIHPGRVVEVDGCRIVVEYNTPKGSQKVTHRLAKFVRTNQFTILNQRPRVKPGQKVKPGDVLADGPAMDHGQLALGQNLLVAFMSWRGWNFEDAIILSERVVKRDLFTSIYIEEFVCDVTDTKLGPEETTYDIPNVPEEKLRNLDEGGVIRTGAEVKAGDILVGKITPKKEVELTPEERLLRAIFGEKVSEVKDSSLYLEHGREGRVIDVKVLSRDLGDISEPGVIKRVQVEVAQLRQIRIGDKLANRHGNKGVVARIVPEEDMPFLADGRSVDIILNPLGVVSRMNVGQILETHLGYAAHCLQYQAVVPSMDGPTEDVLKQELKKAGLPQDGKVTLYDGLTGEPLRQKITVGYIYLMKLNHMVEDKIHVGSVGPYSLITQQPLGGKSQFGGQRLGEMETWALEAYGASTILQEMLTIKSDDVVGRANTYSNIIKGEPIRSPTIPAAFHVLVKELQALGFSIDIRYHGEDESSAEGAKAVLAQRMT